MVLSEYVFDWPLSVYMCDMEPFAERPSTFELRRGGETRKGSEMYREESTRRELAHDSMHQIKAVYLRKLTMIGETDRHSKYGYGVCARMNERKRTEQGPMSWYSLERHKDPCCRIPAYIPPSASQDRVETLESTESQMR